MEPSSGRRRHFPQKYTPRDLALLIEVDRAPERRSGPATQRILKREYQEYGQAEFGRLAGLSVSPLYNLRRSAPYRRSAAGFEPTRPSAFSIGERRRPDPQGRPGFLRVDTVHQGDWEGAKGVYHINAVDTVTQWQVVGGARQISEAFLQPVRIAIRQQFPFRVLGFHTDNGSEFINHTVAQLLGKLLVEFTQSRANRSPDNALVEGKNGAIIRKHLGYGHMAGEQAAAWQEFYTTPLNPYLNFHRPCGFATVSFDPRGKRRRRYPPADYATPYEKLKALPQAAAYLKPGLGFKQLDGWARAQSDTAWAQQMRAAKLKLWQACKSESPLPPRFR